MIAGIGGNILSALLAPQYIKVGASTSLYGIMGIIVGYVIINWSGLNLVGKSMKCQLITLTILLIIFVVIFTSVSSNIDYFGHLGGFLTGVWLSAFHPTIVDNCR